jgi:hypothetical protein
LETGELLQKISCPYNSLVTAGCWLPAVRGATKAFAVGCADGSIHIYVHDQEEVGSDLGGMLAVTCINVPYSTISRYHSIGLTMDPSKISHSNEHAGGWQACPEALFKCGLSMMTVSLHMFIAFIAAMNGQSAQIQSRKATHQCPRSHILPEVCNSVTVVKLYLFFIWKATECMYTEITSVVKSNAVIALLTILTHSDKNGSRRSQLDRM